MKQIAPNYSYNKATGVITLTGVNIDRDQLLLIVNTTRNVTYYNFADSTTTLQAFTQGANTSVTLATSVVSASFAHTNADALTIYYDDQSGLIVSGTVSIALSTTPAVTTFTSITSAPLIASNASRKMLTIQNVGAGILYVLFGSGTASSTNFSVQMNSGDFYECDYYNGQVNAIFASSGTAYVTSLT